jgi:hypothetical protein
MAGAIMSLPPYEARLSERPGDTEQFNDWVTFLIYRCRPGHMYRVPFWASPAKRRRARQDWEQIVRVHMGRVYEIGREGS